MTDSATHPSPPWLTRLALALIMAGPLFVVNKGFDLTDSGYYLFTYRHAFAWPEVNYLTTVLSNWLGGLIYAVLPQTGLFLAYKLICVGLYAGITWFSFVILREHFPTWLNLLALALANAYPLALIYITSYNSFTYLFLSLAILLLYRGLEKERPLFLYLAAIILGLNPFVRLPNILQWGLVAVPFWYYWFCLGRRGRAVSLTLRFTLVMLLTWLAFLGLACLAGGSGWLERELGGLAALLFKSKAQHSAFAMWDTYDLFLRDSLGMSRMAVLFCVPLALALGAGLAAFRHSPAVRPFLAAIGLAAGPAIALVGGQLYGVHLLDGPALNHPLHALCILLVALGPLIALAGLLWYHQRRPLLSALSAAVIVIFMAMPFGSDYGVAHYPYYTHLSLAVILGLAWRLWLDAAAWLADKWPRAGLRDIGLALACTNVLFWFLLAFCLHSLYDDVMLLPHGDAPYGALTAEVPGVPVLAGMKTHPARALWMGGLAEKLALHEELPLVVMGHCPLCHFLSDSQPLLPDPWLDLYSLQPDRINEGLTQAAGEGRLPLVLMVSPKFDLWALAWENPHHEIILKRFMRREGYTLAADHPAYKIHLPPAVKAGEDDARMKPEQEE